MTTTYIVKFFDPYTGAMVEMLDNSNLIKLEYERMVNTVGTINFTARGDSRLIDYLRVVDLLAEVIRVNPVTSQYDVEGTYFIRHAEIFQDEQFQEYIVMSGVSLLNLLERRIILPEDDATGAGGWSTKAGNAAPVITEFVNNQAISPLLNTGRAFLGLTSVSEGVASIGGYVFERVQRENLYEVVQRCALNGGVDFKIDRTSGVNFLFQCNIFGSDLTRRTNEGTQSPMVLFQLERDNITNPQLTFDSRATKNAVYVLGQGPENDREVVLTIGPSASDSPWNSIEATTDARNNEIGDFTGLLQDGNQFVRDNAPKIMFSFELSEVEREQYYNVRWSIYDTVTASYRGYEYDLRVLGVHVTLDENGDTMDVVLSDPTAFIDPELYVMLHRPNFRRDEVMYSYKHLHAEIIRDRRRARRQMHYLERAEVAGARPRITKVSDAQIAAMNLQVGMMLWVTNGRKPGEGIGAGTGVPAEWDGDELISGYSGTAVQT